MKNKSLELILASLLGLVAFVVLSMYTYISFADDTLQSVGIVNAAPTIDTIYTSNESFGSDQSSVVPAEGADFIIYVHGTASDYNGCEDLNDASRWTLKLYRSGVSGTFGCSGNDSNCYSPSSASTLALSGCDGASDTDITYQWTITLKHYVEPTDDSSSSYSSDDWKARVFVTDFGDSTDALVDYFEIATLRAITVPNFIDYGTLSPGDTSEQKNVEVTNTGNDDSDFYIKASGPMVCDRGSIPAAYIHYDLSDGFSYNAVNELSYSDAPVNASITRRTTAISKKPVYFRLKVPANGIAGHCTNTVTFTAKNNE